MVDPDPVPVQRVVGQVEGVLRCRGHRRSWFAASPRLETRSLAAALGNYSRVT